MSIESVESAFYEYKAMYDAGEISPSEYKDLLNSLEISEAIAEGTDELERKQTLNMAINIAITGVSALV